MRSIPRDIPLELLFVSVLNPRQDLGAGQEDSSIYELGASIQEQGLLQPITVRPSTQGRYEVIIGQRRLLACKHIGHDPVPCLVREEIDDADAVTLSLIEDVHRADMNPLDKARALKQLYDLYGSYEQVAKETSLSAQTVSKSVSLLDLPEAIQRGINTFEGAAGMGTLSRLARTFKGEEAAQVYDQIAGFKQSIQMEIFRRSEGDINRVGELRSLAIEGAFEIRQCGGRFKCEVIRDILKGKLTKEEFEDLVQEVSMNVTSGVTNNQMRKAARNFWKSLASP